MKKIRCVTTVMFIASPEFGASVSGAGAMEISGIIFSGTIENVQKI